MDNNISSCIVTRSTPRIFILTTAITRGRSWHSQSIGRFYNQHFISKLADTHNIVHIIHVDYPMKLRNNPQFSLDETISTFTSIIPAFAECIIIKGPTDNPSFANAYTTILSFVRTFNPSSANGDIIWWMEDDWRPAIEYNYLSILKLCIQANTYVPTAITLTDNSPLCSFRGGPVMNVTFFNQMFDIYNVKKNHGIGKKEKASLAMLTFNPEEKVSRNIRMNRTISEYSGNIFIICIFILSKSSFPYTFRNHHPWYYDKKVTLMTKFKKPFGVRYITAFLDTPDSQVIRYTPEYISAYDIPEITNKEDVHKLTCTDIDQFNTLISEGGINYISVYPFVFVDIGRQFCSSHNVGTFASK